jgi:hypothetical protein
MYALFILLVATRYRCISSMRVGRVRLLLNARWSVKHGVWHTVQQVLL